MRLRIRDAKPFVFYGTVCAALTGGALLEGGPSSGEIPLLLVGGLLCWPPLEYALHRFAFHYDAKSERGRDFVYRHHLVHHEFPSDTSDLFASLTTSVPPAALYLLLAWVVLGSWQAAAWCFTGFVAGYVFYEWMHYAAHHSRPRLRVLKWLKKYHMLHHHQDPSARFGVTSPLLDLLFGTYRPVGRR